MAGPSKTPTQLYESDLNLFSMAYVKEWMKYGTETEPMAIKMDRIKILFTPNG